MIFKLQTEKRILISAAFILMVLNAFTKELNGRLQSVTRPSLLTTP